MVVYRRLLTAAARLGGRGLLSARAWSLVAVLVCSLAAVRAYADETSENIDTIVDSVVEAYGGKAALEKLDAFRVEGSLNAHVRGFSGRVTRDYVGPDRYRVQIVYPQQTEVRVLMGSESWRGDANGLVAVDGPPRQAMVYQLLRATLPVALHGHRAQLSLTGKGTWNGASTLLLHLQPVEGVAVNYWVDETTRRVVRVDGSFRGGPMTFQFGTEYSDFRVQDGVLVSFAEENYANGNHTGTTLIDKVTFGSEAIDPFPTSL